MTFERILENLSASAGLVTVDDAEQNVPSFPGLYSIYIDHADALPMPFSGELTHRATRLLYVGKATKNLRTRLIEQDLRHRRGASTFFRSLGAILGYLPPVGSLRGKARPYNFKFGREDTKEIIQWINCHLMVRWCECDSRLINKSERCVIKTLAPLMNLDHNPAKSRKLESLREKCREIAISASNEP